MEEEDEKDEKYETDEKDERVEKDAKDANDEQEGMDEVKVGKECWGAEDGKKEQDGCGQWQR